MPPCRFHNTPGGCRRGDNCSFSHDGPSSQRAQPNRQGPPSKAPRGVCNFYWSNGNCRHEFNCRFEHTRDPSLPTSTTPQPSVALTTPDSLAPFLTPAGLARLTAPGTDVFFSAPRKMLSPNEIHNHVKRYLRDDFRFRTTFEIYGFLVLLGSLNTSGPQWAPEDGPLLLTSLATVVAGKRRGTNRKR